jgi:hypothetical protein
MAITGHSIETNLLNKEEILKRISTYDIYRYYFGPFQINRVCINHFRGEKDESFIIGNRKSPELTHKDFGSDYWKGDAFHLVQQIFNVNFTEALKIIDRDFELGLCKNEKSNKKSKIITWEEPKIENSRPPHFIIETKKFTKEELQYWNDYFIGLEDLKREEIYSIKNIWRNRQRIPNSLLLTFGYYDPKNDKWKIYRPHGKKGKKVKYNERKWDGNFCWDFCENIDNIDTDQIVFSQKSRKDRLVSQKIFETLNVFSVQAEDLSCYTEETLNKIKNARVIAFGDADEKGQSYTKSLRDSFNWETLNPSAEFLPITDYADLTKEKGLTFVKNLLKPILWQTSVKM